MQKTKKNKFIWPLILVVLLLLNYAAAKWHTRFDLTNENRFTLSSPVKKMLKGLDSTVTVEVFLKGDFPSGFKKLGISTNDVLQEFKEVAGNKLQYKFISPDELVPGTDIPYSDTLDGLGLYPINLTSQVKEGQQQQYVYPVALVHYANRSLPALLYKGKTPLINFQELSSAEAMLEYTLANAISKVKQTEKPVVGYTIGNGQPTNINTYDLVENVLSPSYKLFTFDPNKTGLVPQDFSVLLMVKPAEPFTEMAKLKLDQYVMNGGKIIWFIDRLNAEMDSLKAGEVVAYDRELQLNDLLFNYGVRVNPDLVMDLQCDYLPFDVNGNGQYDLLPWNYFPLFGTQNNHPINKNLGFVAGRFVNSIDTVGVPEIKKTVLLASSANARTIGTPAIISGKENSVAPQNEKFNLKNIPVAVLLEGKFKSLYKNRLSQIFADSLQQYGTMFIPDNIKDNKMIVVADGDMVLNDIIKGNEPIPMGMNPYAYGTERAFPFANKDFLENSLDYLINENGLSEAKAKDYVLRLLDTKKLEKQKTMWQIINIAIPVLMIIIFAIIFQWRRKIKYTT